MKMAKIEMFGFTFGMILTALLTIATLSPIA
jgi:hypothetical protein